jgi:hypothetical protein
MTGIVLLAPLVAAMPDLRLQLVEVADLIAAGYLPEPERIEL